jgi:hypothetical protein
LITAQGGQKKKSEDFAGPFFSISLSSGIIIR